MKKLLIFFIIVIVIVAIIAGMYMNYKMNINISKKENSEYENYINGKITGTDLATLINKAINNNEKNNVAKDENGLYTDNSTNSINIQIEFTDNDKVYSMESIYNGTIANFIDYYGNIKFECTKTEYHKNTNKIKALYFKQVN
jgi:hypothetical protein